MEDYNPNIKRAKQTVEVTFMAWDYKAKHSADIGGNCLGFEIMESAISNIYDKLPTHNCGEDIPYLILKTDGGEELECADDELRGYDWLKDMAIKAEITGRADESTTTLNP